MPLDQVMLGSEKLLGTRKRADKGVRLALKRRAICVLNLHTGPLIQLYGPAVIEQQLESRIECLLSGPKPLGLFEDCEAQLQKLIHDYCARESANGIRFTVKQMEAIFMALSSKLSILTGFGGTGKTTILRAVVDLAKMMRREPHVLARVATGHRAFSIHAFIAAVKKGAKDINLDGNPLIIIDEASTVDTVLFNELLGLMDGKNFSLLTVGDTSQVSPAGFGLVWHRLAMMPEIPTVHLTEVHRQQSVLHKVAMAVRMFGGNGDDIKIPEWRGEAEGVYHVHADKRNLRQKLLLLKWIESQKGFSPAQILTPHMTEHMPDSGSKINRYIQKELTGHKDGIRLGMHWLRVGDPVIVSENNNDLGLFNGTTGKLLRVDTSGDTLTGVFSLEGHDEDILLTTDDLFDVAMKPAYAISIHNNQGSEYDTTIITAVADSPMVERSMIYTALTRAKKLCLIVGSIKVFVDAISKPSRAETLSVGLFMSKLTR
jgi:exodeoxyribonuclease V alpha subunit